MANDLEILIARASKRLADAEMAVGAARDDVDQRHAELLALERRAAYFCAECGDRLRSPLGHMHDYKRAAVVRGDQDVPPQDQEDPSDD